MPVLADSIVAVRTRKIVYHDGENAIKVFDSDYSAAEIFNEALNHARIEETDLHIPKLLKVQKIDDRWAIYTRFIDGVTLEQLMLKNKSRQETFLQQFVDIQKEVHSQSVPLLYDLRVKCQYKIQESSLDDSLKTRLLSQLQSFKYGLQVCHADFNPSNILIATDGTPFILDWSHACRGNPLSDCAFTYLYFDLSAQAQLAETYLGLYTSGDQAVKDEILAWLPVIAASKLEKARSDEKERLIYWAHQI